MEELGKGVTFGGYGVTTRPGAKTNSWTGKRKEMEALGYGFLLLARGRAGNAIRTAAEAGKIGVADAREAVRSGKAEGFASGGVKFFFIEGCGGGNGGGVGDLSTAGGENVG